MTAPAAPWWPVWIGAAIRLALWLVVPARFASDEDSYYQVATALLAGGERDLFWPPFTAWLIAMIRVLPGADSVAAVRLAWVLMDIGCLALVRVLAMRVAIAVSDGTGAAQRLATLMTLGYAIYLPAISFAEFATSEIPALLQVLAVLTVLTTPGVGPRLAALAGILAGTVTLTRPSLLPLAGVLPAVLLIRKPFDDALRASLAMILGATAVIGGYLAWNWVDSGELMIGRNSAYNLYLGNRDMYGEDLNLLQPRATPEQIEFRRQMWSGELIYPTQTAAELQREAFAWIADHPATFLRRAVGRLARVFVPRTDVLELAGGEQSAGLFNPLPLSLLVVANAQWTVVLFAGITGLAVLWGAERRLAALFLATIAGSVMLCLVAISKPRYSFVFDPLLIISATIVVCAPRDAWRSIPPRGRTAIGVVSAFLVWGWIAWVIFALTSRTA